MVKRADQVLGSLRRDIITGVHQPGDRMTESSLCDVYAVSRVPVREALKQLEVEGFVTSVAYAGVRVAHLDRHEAADLFTVRRTIEELSTRRSAERFRDFPDDPAVIAFAAQLDRIVRAGLGLLSATDRTDLPPLNTQFHLGIAEFSRNSSLVALLRQISSKVEWLYAMDVHVRGEHSWEEHKAISEAVRAGDPERASELMGLHVQSSFEGYLSRHTPASPHER